MQKTFGPLIIQTGTVYKTIMLPVEIVVFVDPASIHYVDGRLEANTLLTAYYRTSRLGHMAWEDLTGCPLVRDAISQYLTALGYEGRISWSPTEHSQAGMMELRMDRRMVESIFDLDVYRQAA